ncbi:hypothetical protein BEWA_003940 [Theileria equi strain WA]|uniref:Uncharacterized protein n=1 Tax=Theileria equi strain WA TaxID=1537102 RepID=L0B174_THEEQ|nr:hypothetical protein BEWA_003940 [Theileria equi strain WA]AFZ80986.1 hypothetical protein BEWA_003940 [Theileria equi strain WA]|eukprot:XP_004830652.1 hypothetical protein BEWA_003940 [Theileria equi strain WA]
MDDTFTKWLNEVCNKAKVTAESVFNVLSDGSKRMNRIRNVKYAKQLEEGLMETSQYSFLIQECILFWSEHMGSYTSDEVEASSSPSSANSSPREPETKYIDVDANGKQIRTLNFKQVLIRSSAIENLTRTIIKSGSGLGAIEDVALATARTDGTSSAHKSVEESLDKPQEETEKRPDDLEPKDLYHGLDDDDEIIIPTIGKRDSESSFGDSVIQGDSIFLVDPCDSKSSCSNSSSYSLGQTDSLGLKYYIDEYADSVEPDGLPDASIEEDQATGVDGTAISNSNNVYIKGLQKIFSHCLIGPSELHNDLIAAILTLKPVDDTHPELLIQLVSTLKIHWMDDFLVQERERIKMEIKNIEKNEQSLEAIRQTVLLYKLALKNVQEYDTHSVESQSEVFEKLALLRKMLNMSEQTCLSNIGTRANSMGVYTTDGEAIWPKTSIQPDEPADFDPEDKLNKYESTLMDERMLNRLIVESRDKMLFLEEDIKMLNERKERLVAEVSQIDEEIAMKMEMLNIKLKEVETAQIELSAFSPAKINVNITDGASTHNTEDRSDSIGPTLSTERSKVSLSNADAHDQMYRGFYRDVKMIEKYASTSKEFIGSLYSSIHADFEEKHSSLMEQATKVVTREAELERERLKTEVENAKSIMGQIQDIKGKMSRHSKSSAKHTTEDASLDAKMRSQIYADLKSVLMNDLKESFIKVEQVWSDFVDFYSDNKEFFGTNVALYTEMKELYDQAKKGFSSFL